MSVMEVQEGDPEEDKQELSSQARSGQGVADHLGLAELEGAAGGVPCWGAAGGSGAGIGVPCALGPGEHI